MNISNRSESSHLASVFWAFVGAHVLLWTVLPILLHPNAPLDVVEQISWGREWQLGYYKHPPLASWLTNAAYTATGGRLWGIFLMSQLCVASCFWAVWRLARDIVDGTRALAAVLLLEGVTYFSISAPEFNPNVLELPIWALFALCGYRALTRGRLGYWIALGACAGVGMWAKYYTAVLVVAFVAFVVFDRRARAAFRTPGPYLAALTAILVFAPHAAWMIDNEFITITYAAARGEAKNAVAARLAAPFSFTASQLPALALMLIGFFVIFGKWKTKREGRQGFDCRYVAALALGPFVVSILLAVVLGWRLRAMWGTPLWSLLPLLLVCVQARESVYLRKVVQTVATVAVVLALALSASLALGPYFAKPRKALYPGHQLGSEITARWRASTDHPLRFVIGDTWFAGNVAFYSPDRPSTLTDGDRRLSPWVDVESLRRSGAVVVWDGNGEFPSELRARFPQARVQEALALSWQTRANSPPVSVGWAIIPPQE